MKPMRVFLLGATPEFDVAPGQSIDHRLAKTGGNTGNQVIAHGLLRTIEYQHVSWDYGIGPRRVDEEYDLILIAAANFLFPGFDFGGMASFIESTKLPVAVAGLGAQSNDYSPAIDLKPGTERLVKVLSERARTIGVRGHFTAEVLAQRGVHNVKVLGCPSFYMRGDRGYAVERSLATHPRVALNLSRDVVKHSFNPELVLGLLAKAMTFAVQNGADFVAQTEQQEMRIPDLPPGSERDAMVAQIAQAYFNGAEPPAGFREWTESHLLTFWSVAEWVDAMTRYGFVFGQRFHGNMIALASGTPAVWIHHDSRTEEMCRFFGLPAVSLEDASRREIASLADAFSIEGINARYPALLAEYRSFLSDNGLSPVRQRAAAHTAAA
ncbi:polysaccharide pyruvyl transferase family protein [Alsobacter sp. R-9]